jgi:hypothetical protein
VWAVGVHDDIVKCLRWGGLCGEGGEGGEGGGGGWGGGRGGGRQREETARRHEMLDLISAFQVVLVRFFRFWV